MTLGSSSLPSASSSPSFSWAGLRSPVFTPRTVIFSPTNRTQDNCSNKEATPTDNSRLDFSVLASKCTQEKSWQRHLDLAVEDIDEKQEKCRFAETANGEEKMVCFQSPVKGKAVEIKMASGARKRPKRIIIPDSGRCISFVEKALDNGENEFQGEGRDFYVASKRGVRKATEDGYAVITDISGDPKQAFFGVFDGHGGRAAVDYVIKKLGSNILTAVGMLERSEDQVQEAIRTAYKTTDMEFLSQAVRSGVCAATVLLKNGELHVANVGDCRVVLSKNGEAKALTTDHRPGSEDEQRRIESSGGYVSCCNGVWRVHGSLAVSRAIGDVDLKEWIISEPEINKLRLTGDCEFLVMASDGLWDKVSNQEAVDVVMKHKKSIESCKALLDISSSRGSNDDITVMVVYLQNFRVA